MAYYVFGELLAPYYDEHYCLGSPYYSLEEVKEAAKVNGWSNWITGDGSNEFISGRKYKIPAHFKSVPPAK